MIPNTRLVALAIALLAPTTGALADGQTPARCLQDWCHQDVNENGVTYSAAFTMDTRSFYSYDASLAVTYFPQRQQTVFAIKRPRSGMWGKRVSVSYQIDNKAIVKVSDVDVGDQMISWPATFQSLEQMATGNAVTVTCGLSTGELKKWTFSLAGYPETTEDIRTKTKEMEERTRNASEDWPEMSTSETDVISRVVGVAMTDTLRESDLVDLRAAMWEYVERTKRPLPLADLDVLTAGLEKSLDYNREVGRCVLQSIDASEPFFSNKLEKLKAQMLQIGTRQSKIDSDMRLIVAAASGKPFKDEFGDMQSAPTRDDALNSLKRVDMIEANMTKYRNVIEDVAKASQQKYGDH